MEKIEIQIKKGGEYKTFVCDDLLMILSNPGGLEGIKVYSSDKSLPRQLGWLEFAKLFVQRNVSSRFEHAAKNQEELEKQANK